MEENKLYFLLIGCTPPGRNTEQHDVFFGIGRSLNEMVPAMNDFWPDANGKIHIDSWRAVTKVDSYNIRIVPKAAAIENTENKLFFLNLGGYKPNDLEEYHYKLLAVAKDKSGAIQQSKKTAFYLHTGFEGAQSHIDDKFGVDVDDVYEIRDILSDELKNKLIFHSLL